MSCDRQANENSYQDVQKQQSLHVLIPKSPTFENKHSCTGTRIRTRSERNQLRFPRVITTTSLYA